ncbi:MAG: ftsQ [Lacunisphaera sp.]|jgi:cell division protein FtsQ|nr:ftsQ [Lacunisphaera sp.]
MSAPAPISGPTPGRSWRNIRQEVKPLAMSRQGRRRRTVAGFKVGALCTLVAALGWGGYVIVHEWETDRAALAIAVHSEPVRDIVLIPSGVLTQKWVEEVLALPKSASLMALDLRALRDKLTAHGQVRVAVVTRRFPDTLVVTIEERTPVARVQANDESGATKQLLVAKDGVVYEGQNYNAQMLAGLPWLDGIRLVRAGNGFEPIDGMADVSALLSTVQLQAPHLYREWLIVSLARLAGSDEIVVKAQDIPEIVFTRKRDFFKQIAQLDFVIEDAARVMAEPSLKSVNLTFENQVPVLFGQTPEELAKTPAPLRNFSIPTPQRKDKRDL